MSERQYSTILIHQTGDNLTITINRPEKRNALNQIVIDELIDVFQKYENEPSIRYILLRGQGNAFCSGADIEYMQKLNEAGFEANLNDSLRLAELYLTIYKHSKPVIAIVNGPAIGGGCGLATVCDFVIATPASRYGYPEVKIGFVAAMVSVFLIRQIGERRARELLLTGRIINAEQAKSIGLISEVVEEKSQEAYIRDLTNKLKENSPIALTKTKGLFSEFTFSNLKEELHKMATVNAEIRSSDEFIEGITAFIEKRKPRWNI